MSEYKGRKAGKEYSMADSKSGYAGRIQNAGAQKVNAPYAGGGKKGKSTATRGSDLRTGKSGK